MGKFIKALLCASLLVSMVSFCGCSKEPAKASTDSVSSVSVEEKIEQTEEVSEPSVLIEDFYDPEKVYVFLNETEEAILSITKEYLVTCGKLDASDKLFFSSSSDFQNAVGPQMRITNDWDYQMLSFTLKDGSLDKIFVTDVVRSGSENGEKLKSVKVCDMEEYVKAIEEIGDEYTCTYGCPVNKDGYGICSKTMMMLYPLMEAVRSGGDLENLGGEGKYTKTIVCPDGCVIFRLTAQPLGNENFHKGHFYDVPDQA